MKEATNQIAYKLIPLFLFVIFFCISACYVIFFYQPHVGLQINDGQVIYVTSRQEAEVEVYSQLPYQTVIETNEGNQIQVDTRLLGLSYFSQQNIDLLNSISGTTISERIRQFFDLSFQNKITVYSDQLFLHGQIEETLLQFPNLLKQEPLEEHLIPTSDGQLVVEPAKPGFHMKSDDFIATLKEIEASGDFSTRYVESQVLYATSAQPLAEYLNLVGLKQFQFSSNMTMLQNIRIGYYPVQNIFIPANSSVSVTDQIGSIDSSRGFISMEDQEGNSKIGVGIDELIAAFAMSANENNSVLSITRYKGDDYSVGQVDGLDRVLELQNHTDQDIVMSSILEGDQFLVIIAKR